MARRLQQPRTPLSNTNNRPIYNAPSQAQTHVPELPDIPSQCFLPAVSRNVSFNQDAHASNNRASYHLNSIHDWIPDPVQPYHFPESVTECASLMSNYNDIPPTNFGPPHLQQPVISAPTEQTTSAPSRAASRQSSHMTRSRSQQIRSQHIRHTTPASDVPTGACNFINLNIAGNVRCGCQRYFDKSATMGGSYTGVSYWCMCEHHACYHEAGRPQAQAPPAPALVEAPLSIMASQELPMMSIHGDTDLPDTAAGTTAASTRDMHGPASNQLNLTHDWIPDQVLQNHEERLEHLENATHSVACASERDACECDCDLVASRVDRYDSRVGKIERALSARRFKGFAQLEDNEQSFVSEATTDISAGRQEMYDRVDSRMGDLESRMSKLDGSITLPSASIPWEFEVVFLPFGAELAKVWSSGESFGSQIFRRSMSRKDSNQDLFVLNSEASASKFFTKAPRENSWEHTLEEAYDKSGILSARACNVDSLIDQRLRSRGLVRMIEVKGPDAQHVQFAIFEAFGDLLQEVADGPPNMPKLSSKVPKKLRRYKEALSSSWIPLRKLHKDSKLRFLETSEMITSSLWTPSFLSEVAMNQAGRRRLFITGRESYIQHENNLLSGSGWTWEAIRKLTPFDPDASQAEDYEFRHRRNTVMVLSEPCWDHDGKLDAIRRSKEPELPGLDTSATHQTTTTVQQSNLKFPLSVHDSFVASFHSVEHDEDATSSIANSSSSIASSPAPSAASLRFSNSPVPMSRKVSDSISPLTNRNAFENINITTRSGRRGLRSRTSSQTPAPGTSFGLEMARKRQNPYSSIFEDVKPRRSYPLSSSPAKATTSGMFMDVKRQRTRSPSKPRDTPRWSVGRSSPSPFIFEDRSRSNTRETTAGPANLLAGEGGDRKRGLTPFAYATPFSIAPVVVKRERSWGSAASAGLKNLDQWNEDGSGTDEAESDNEGYESDFFQPRQVTTPAGEWDAMQTDNEETMRQNAPAVSSFGAEQHALSENDGNISDVSDAPSEYPSTQVKITKQDKGKGIAKEPLVDSTENFVDVKDSATFAIHED